MGRFWRAWSALRRSVGLLTDNRVLGSLKQCEDMVVLAFEQEENSGAL